MHSFWFVGSSKVHKVVGRGGGGGDLELIVANTLSEGWREPFAQNENEEQKEARTSLAQLMLHEHLLVGKSIKLAIIRNS